MSSSDSVRGPSQVKLTDEVRERMKTRLKKITTDLARLLDETEERGGGAFVARFVDPVSGRLLRLMVAPDEAMTEALPVHAARSEGKPSSGSAVVP